MGSQGSLLCPQDTTKAEVPCIIS